ncbi:uncharacterized protein LAJ45_01377 [Morchella importuna]|uniref:mRNA decay factor PAT1 domain-containing protein n=1 Tax=Morchella conica CCBAS932 TaxID=1392247 RepID=A0A3N4KAY1_9PEZI|nr:uncharacterized protein LAJ45_01377 [Morchella importuna]KAH8154846.1 hypothetical protein LAJ45_01377 [Morchella importuna]RPB07660.1 hypothetical protein P167DRAFT_495455 [Morchella conica CCBAS932]
MSFFGFDTGPLRDRGQHPATAPGFSQIPDHFASRPNDDDDDDGIDFEDTYDGLGDALDEKDDAFNDETFGGGDDKIGKDFDFHGQTAKVADAMDEEHEVFNRSARKPSVVHSASTQQQQPSRQALPPAHVPALRPDMSLWGGTTISSTPPPPPAAEIHREQTPSARAPTQNVKKYMSLDEVEAEILMSQKPLVMAPQPVFQGPPPQQVHQYIHQQPDFHQIPQHGGFSMQMQNMLRGSQQQQQHMQAPQMIHQQQQHPDHLRGIPTPVGPAGGARLPPHEQLQEPRNVYGMAPHAPASQLQNMSEIERTRFLEDERKRLKRNHKIAQLARYNGLMTPNDKNFITRIQLQQLVSINNADDAANEDFYYIVHSAIRARANPTQPLNQFAQTYLYRQGRGNRRQDNHLHRMEQQVQRAVAAAKARPKASQLVLEGSLGKISFSNVKTPRPMLNIKKNETGVGEQVRKTQRSTISGAGKKTLLLTIENVYNALLNLECHERDRGKLPPPPETNIHTEWEAKRQLLVSKLWQELKIMSPIDPSSNQTHPFIAILSYTKMKRAIQRIFRHLDEEQRVTVLTMIVVHLDILDVVKNGVYQPHETTLPSATREEIDLFASTVLPSLISYVYEAPLRIVIGLLGILLERVDVVLVSKTKIGLAFLTMFSSRAEIVKQSGKANENELAQWQAMYDRLFETLQGHWMGCFPPNGMAVDDVYVWQFLASVAVGASMPQQQMLVGAVKDRVMENVMASKTLPAEIGTQKSANVNLFMRAIGLDVELLG